jgi:hypothetical protein
MKERRPIRMRKGLILLILVAVFGFSAVANATLIAIGEATYNSTDYNLIYDNDSPFGSIVYLDYSKSHDNWSNMVAWADGLNSAIVTYNFLPGYSMNWGGAWRLPNTVDAYSSAGYNSPDTSSEMVHLYYAELGNTANAPSINKGPFTNLQSDLYWSGTLFALEGSHNAWFFNMGAGGQSSYDKNGTFFLGLAVRPGLLVETEPVPEPSTMLLLGLGLVGLAGARKKFNK